MSSRRSKFAEQYRALYATPTWARLRKIKLAQDPLCERCLADGRGTIAATVAHHRRPHRGDPALFYDIENLEAVCKECHDTSCAREDGKGFSTAVDATTGWPTDPRHPANRRRGAL
jgi:5-methylcytosine-specific restriction endonuclease McrA